MKDIQFQPGAVIRITISEQELDTLSPELRVKIEALIRQNEDLLAAQVRQEGSSPYASDSQTNAANRHAFYAQANVHFKLMKRFKMAEKKGRAMPMPLASVVALKLVGFKQIHDFSGYKAADEALKDCSVIFERSLRPNDYFARIGRDEFYILMLADEATTRVVMERMRADFEKHFTAPGQSQHYLSYVYGVRQLQPSHAAIAQVIKESEQELAKKP